MKTFVVGDVHGRRSQLHHLLEILARDPRSDMLVLLGDLIDRGEDSPGVVADVIRLQRETPELVRVLRGNHEQMLLDMVDEGARVWLHPPAGGTMTYEQYTGRAPCEAAAPEPEFEAARRALLTAIPADHLEFFRRMPLYYEDEHAIYVHAGLDQGKHPRETEARLLLWTRDEAFYKNYRGKPCVFGHTPTTFLPWRGRLGRHGIYIFHSAIGLDTGYSHVSPLSCLSLPDFTLYQTFADGRSATHHITTFIPETIRAMQRGAGDS